MAQSGFDPSGRLRGPVVGRTAVDRPGRRRRQVFTAPPAAPPQYAAQQPQCSGRAPDAQQAAPQQAAPQQAAPQQAAPQQPVHQPVQHQQPQAPMTPGDSFAGITGELVDGRFSENEDETVAKQNSKMLRVRIGEPFFARQGDGRLPGQRRVRV